MYSTDWKKESRLSKPPSKAHLVNLESIIAFLTMNNSQTWDPFHKGHLFYARDSTKNDSDPHHIAEMIAILGPPPKEIIQCSEYAAKFFDGEGTSLIN